MGTQERKCCICNDMIENKIKDNKGKLYCSEECAIMGHLDGKLGNIVYSTINLSCSDLLIRYLEKDYFEDINKDSLTNQKLTKNNNCNILDLENGCSICHCCLDEEIIDSNGNKYCSEQCVVMAHLDGVLDNIEYSTLDLCCYEFLEEYLKENYLHKKLKDNNISEINNTIDYENIYSDSSVIVYNFSDLRKAIKNKEKKILVKGKLSEKMKPLSRTKVNSAMLKGAKTQSDVAGAITGIEPIVLIVLIMCIGMVTIVALFLGYNCKVGKDEIEYTQKNS